ncbi:MAG: hypothetical protein JWM87_3751 [Candidatus Eremiobacteraeota bacterium]|nr:hypothetical protein [Candidatus Eremiobacteraeota bacterium]
MFEDALLGPPRRRTEEDHAGDVPRAPGGKTFGREERHRGFGQFGESRRAERGTTVGADAAAELKWCVGYFRNL